MKVWSSSVNSWRTELTNLQSIQSNWFLAGIWRPNGWAEVDVWTDLWSLSSTKKNAMVFELKKNLWYAKSSFPFSRICLTAESTSFKSKCCASKKRSLTKEACVSARIYKRSRFGKNDVRCAGRRWVLNDVAARFTPWKVSCVGNNEECESAMSPREGVSGKWVFLTWSLCFFVLLFAHCVLFHSADIWLWNKQNL